MFETLSKEHRNLLARVTLAARERAEKAARAALENLAVHEKDYRGHMTVEQRQLRNRLRARGRALGDRLDARTGTQRIDHLAEDVGYENWHRLLFTRFLAENHLLHTDEANGSVPVTLEECEELAPELGARDGLDLACRFASRTLPGVFRVDNPVLELRLAPNDEAELRKLLASLPSEVFKADDALGWTYQFWQAKRKDEVNSSGNKIGADELPAVTQLFTEDYMVEFLLHNTLGAWWAGKRGPIQSTDEKGARAAVTLPAKDDFPAITWTYLRFIQDEQSKTWSPAAGTFSGWPKTAKEIKFLDPCMGSGHFVVFALPLIARMRMEEEGGSSAQAIRTTLSDNLFNLEIDDRCTQIAAFNVALTAWKLGGYQTLPLLHIACSGLGPNAPEKTWVALAGKNDRLQRGMARLYALFKDAPVLGSLINPSGAASDLVEAEFHELQPLLTKALHAEKSHDDDRNELGVVAEGLAKAAEILAGQYTLVATNVPYLGRGKQDDVLKDYCERMHHDAKADLATCFVERCLAFCAPSGTIALVAPHNWWFLTTYSRLRQFLLETYSFRLAATLGEEAWQEFGDRGPMAVLMVWSNEKAMPSHRLSGIDALPLAAINKKIAELMSGPIRSLSQVKQARNPDHRILIEELDSFELLQSHAEGLQGISSADLARFIRKVWEFPNTLKSWSPMQSSFPETTPHAGREHVLKLKELSDHADEQGGAIRGSKAWGKGSVIVRSMRHLSVTLGTGEPYDANVASVLPRNPQNLPAIWAFCSSEDYLKHLRKLDKKTAITNATLVKVPFDVAHWRKVAAEKYPNGLPKPHSDNPTQWLFNGHPKGSEQPLQVAVARLVGYRWPRQTGSSFPDCPALGPDDLEAKVDADGVVCLPPISRERPAAARLRGLLALAFGSEWSAGKERDLLAAADSTKATLEDWLRDEFFEQHCTLFHNRPFVWHIWDGRKDGFHALVNYHRLDHAMLQKLTYSHLGDWIRQQEEEAKADKPGAADRLGAARSLQSELAKILEGEPPYDIFVRWKPLKEQPLGWQPDLNDGVRLNIRPFMTARDVGKKGAGILRTKPNIKWDKDRGKEPKREKKDFPWFWHDDEPPIDCPGEREFAGHRWNDVHLTLARKRAARQA